MSNAIVFPKLTEKEEKTLRHIPHASFNDNGLDSCWWTDVYCDENEFGAKVCRAILVSLKKKGMIDLYAAASKKHEDASTFELTDLAKAYLGGTEAVYHSQESKRSRHLLLDLTGIEVEAPTESTVKPEADEGKESLPISKSQLEIIEELKKNIPLWDEGILVSCRVVVKKGQICLVTRIESKNESYDRETFIGRNGGIRAYGKKNHSKHPKLMRSYDDVVKYGRSLV